MPKEEYAEIVRHDGVMVGFYYVAADRFEMGGIDAERRIRDALPGERIIYISPEGDVRPGTMKKLKGFLKPPE